MTSEEKKLIRENSSMKAFTFYLDDVTKLEVLKKLRQYGCDQEKGTLSALIRVLLSEFANCNDEAILLNIIYKVKDEYMFTTKKNKRSTM